MKPKSALSELKEKERQARRAMIINAAELEFTEKPFFSTGEFLIVD